jgi:hypothetical protein
MEFYKLCQKLAISLVKLSFKPLQGLRGCGAEPHIKIGCEV